IAEGTSAASFGTSNLIIISGENTVQSIINAIPNQGEGAQVFDPKRNLTAYKDQDGTIVVSQGRPVTANGKQAKLPEHRFGKYDDGYAMVSALVDNTETNKGLNATTVKTPITHSASPKFLENKNKDLIEETTTYFGNNIPTIS